MGYTPIFIFKRSDVSDKAIDYALTHREDNSQGQALYYAITWFLKHPEDLHDYLGERYISLFAEFSSEVEHFRDWLETYKIPYMEIPH